jgi:mannose-1-phosphate guanylyltransferase
MIAVIIAGGSGTRLWPMSTPSYPKHLLNLTDESSLLQNTLARARKLTDDSKILVITDSSHTQHVVDQLSDFDTANILSEPARRGTASCVLYAMQHIKQLGLDKNEPVVFLWADHLIRDQEGFITSFKRAASLAKKYEKVVFIGAEPTYPSTGFGYLEHGKKFNQEENVYDLVSFHEKPEANVARKYLRSGRYFWNMGYLVSTLNVFEAMCKQYSPNYFESLQTLVKAKDVKKAYLDLENIAVDYAFSEKIKEAIVIPGNFDWVDIGSFKDLHEISDQDNGGNHIKGDFIELENTTNSFVRNDVETPVVVIGLDNIVVVNTKNGILVTNKNYAQKVGDVAKRLQQ